MTSMVARPRRAVVLSAGCQGGRMECVHQSPALGGERNVDALGWRSGRDEEPRPAAVAEPDVARQVEEDPYAERGEGLLIEGATCGDVSDAEHDVIDHEIRMPQAPRSRSAIAAQNRCLRSDRRPHQPDALARAVDLGYGSYAHAADGAALHRRAAMSSSGLS